MTEAHDMKSALDGIGTRRFDIVVDDIDLPNEKMAPN